jgi:hypothetical protein
MVIPTPFTLMTFDLCRVFAKVDNSPLFCMGDLNEDVDEKLSSSA